MLHHKVIHADSATSDTPWVILIHGLFGSLDNLGGVARSLKGDCHCVLVDLPNHGQSKTINNIAFKHIADNLAAMMNHLDIEEAHVIGHSLGGKAALDFALNYPKRVSSVIAADIAPVKYPHRHQAVFEGLKNVDLAKTQSRQHALAQLSEHVKEPGTQQFLLKSLYRENDQWRWRFRIDEIIQDYPILIDWPEHKTRFEKPVLFIIGGNSDYVTPEHQPQIRKLFPNASAKIIHGTGHWLHAEKPAAFNRIVNRHIQQFA